ncbi:MAG: hypothetical protein ACREFI_18935 [Stellaceae bacterium]
MRATGRLPALAAALIFGTATATAAAELVVVETRGITTLKQGDAVSDAQPIKLEDGQMVTLVAEDGSILTLRGPYDQTPAGGGSGGVDVASALGALTTGKAQNVAGVVRSANAGLHLPSPWLMDVSHPGVACIRQGEQPVLWRESDAGNGTLTMMPADRSWRAQAPWPASSPTLQAPSNFPIKDGRTYLADFGGKPVAVTLTQIPPKVTSPRMQAAWMLEKGCVAQAEALLKTVR